MVLQSCNTSAEVQFCHLSTDDYWRSTADLIDALVIDADVHVSLEPTESGKDIKVSLNSEELESPESHVAVQLHAEDDHVNARLQVNTYSEYSVWVS